VRLAARCCRRAQPLLAPGAVAFTSRDLWFLAAGGVNLQVDTGLLLVTDTDGVTRCYLQRDTIDRWGESIDTLYLYVLTPLDQCIGG
jgi:hypothetical protein